MKRSYSERNEEENEESYCKRRNHKRNYNRKESRHNDDHSSSKYDDHRSSRCDDYGSSRKDNNHRSSTRDDDHKNLRYNNDRRKVIENWLEESRLYRELEKRKNIWITRKTQENRKEVRQKPTVDLLTSKMGGAYIPSAKLHMLEAEITDKSGAAYQRIAWEALKKSIHGCINKINASNIRIVTRKLLRENIIRGRGLLVRSIIQAQAASPIFTPVYAALTAVINSKFPNIGELVLTRLVLQFKCGFKRNDKPLCISSGTFIAHLINQGVAYEIIALEILIMLLEIPTDDSVEVAIAFLKECGMKLTEVLRRGAEAIFEMLRIILHEGQLDKRVQYMIEVMFQIRKDGFKDHEAIPQELDLVEEEDQITHLIRLDDEMDAQDILNVFKFDATYLASEENYKQLCKEILGLDVNDSEDNDGNREDESSDEDSSTEQVEGKKDVIFDNTETNLRPIALRTMYLTIYSALNSALRCERTRSSLDF